MKDFFESLFNDDDDKENEKENSEEEPSFSLGEFSKWLTEQKRGKKKKSDLKSE